ncbi:MAG TPA: N-acetylmuramoyl-L-alanine amidase [Bacteroidota bacterium]|nr:N-acetylmuramoyl-L-alanine amidase [Bacteroidota bacterium]
MTRILLPAVVFAICTLQLSAQPVMGSVPLTLSTDAKHQSDVPSALRGQVRYIAIDDLARFVGARIYANIVLKKVELILPAIRFKCTAESYFVVVTRTPDASQTVPQLTSPIVMQNGVFMLPVQDFLDLYESQTKQKILFTLKDNASAKKPADVTVKQDESVRKSADVASPAYPVITEKKDTAQPSEGSSAKWEPSPQLSIGSAEKSSKYTITGIDVEEKRNGYLLHIRSSQRMTDIEKVLQAGTWLYLTIPKAKGNVSQLGGLFQTGIVKRVIPLQSAEGLQLSFQLREKVESAEVIENPDGTDILVALRVMHKDRSDAAGSPSVEKPTAARQSKSVQRSESTAVAKQPTRIETNAERQKNKWKLDVVVLDAGHGGHDPGTIGSMGTHEKDVTLGIALKLGALIERNMPGVKVVYTRKTDTFVELYRRGQMANEAGGKLFISIHCNSTPKKSTAANGFEIYLLRPGKTETAIEIAEQENSVVRLEKGFEDRYQKLTEENFIIVTMAQSAYVKQSERFAELLESEMAKKMVYQSRGVKQAGFYVLVGASMPNILVETGYLSNKKDETLLRGLAGQYLAAESIYDGLKKFKTEYESNFSEY